MNTKPQSFTNITHIIHSIIDASDIFIETPKNPDDQKKTWSEYKHITLKELISVKPNSFQRHMKVQYLIKTDTKKPIFRKVTNVYNYYG